MPSDYIVDTANLDLMVVKGDFVLAESTGQHQRLLLQTIPGEYKSSPLTGVGLPYYLLDERPGNMLSVIRKKFTADGMIVASVSITEDGKLTIDAKYNE